MKIIGVTALLVGGAFFAVYAGAWIALIAEHGLAEAVRRAFTLWPSIVVQIVLLALALLFSGGGFLLLATTDRK
jgi:hypothetical protein